MQLTTISPGHPWSTTPLHTRSDQTNPPKQQNPPTPPYSSDLIEYKGDNYAQYHQTNRLWDPATT